MPQPTTLSWDDIKLPETDQNKPNESTPDSPAVEATPAPQTADIPEIKDDAAPADGASSSEEKKDDTAPATAPSESAKAPESDNKDDATATDGGKDEGGKDANGNQLTPFHQHPDWIKQQDEMRRLKEENARMSGQIDTLTKVGGVKQEPQSPYEMGLTPSQVTEKRIEAKLKAGWKPKDQVEVSLETTKILQEEQSKYTSFTQSKEAQAAQSYNDQITSKLDSLGVKDQVERDVVIKQVLDWAEQGTKVSVETLGIATEMLKLQGKILKSNEPTKPTQTEESKAKEKKALEDKAAANTTISKSKGDGKGTPTGPTKKFTPQTDLDTMVAELGKTLQ